MLTLNEREREREREREGEREREREMERESINWTWYWLEWAQLKAQVRIPGHPGVERGKIFPGLTISGQTIPPAEVDSFKFLGMPVRVNNNNDSARSVDPRKPSQDD